MTRVPELVGISKAAKALETEIDLAARSDAKVLVTGESGVGKEVVARQIHHRSLRRNAPLVTINCAGIPETLLASELFGHVRGSFTDAHRDKVGWLEQAHRGTIFMDEIGEMSTSMQSLLLRFLENGEIQRVGSDRRNGSVDVRVITATNRRLTERVAANEFREDLFYRLNVIHIEIPPLRERREDIPSLLEYFIRAFGEMHSVERPRFGEGTMAQLTAVNWPGNVRQLRNVVERLVLRSRGGVINVDDLPKDLVAPEPAESATQHQPCAAEEMFNRMVRNGDDFWAVVHAPFMAHDLTREDVRTLVHRTLELTRGSYKSMAQLFNLPDSDYKRLLNFLRKSGCHLPVQPFRELPVGDRNLAWTPSSTPAGYSRPLSES
jgi:DNA-binding NtrC family response regulator